MSSWCLEPLVYLVTRYKHVDMDPSFSQRNLPSIVGPNTRYFSTSGRPLILFLGALLKA